MASRLLERPSVIVNGGTTLLMYPKVNRRCVFRFQGPPTSTCTRISTERQRQRSAFVSPPEVAHLNGVCIADRTRADGGLVYTAILRQLITLQQSLNSVHESSRANSCDIFGPPAEPARESDESRGGTSAAGRTAVKSIRGAAAAAPRSSASGSPLAAEAMNVSQTKSETRARRFGVS